MSVTPGFIQGRAAEVKLADVLPPALQSNATKVQKEAFASAYEEKHGIVVVRDWEDVPDHVLALLPEKERLERLSDRANLERRRATQVTKPKVAEPTMGMDPVRAERELRRQRQMFEGLTPDHPDYRNLFANAVKVIHELEDCCGMERTSFEIGVPVPKQTSGAIPKETQDKYTAYSKLPRDKRRKSIQLTEDLPYVKLISTNEADSELQELALVRVGQLALLAG